jgi:hypothetical protein
MDFYLQEGITFNRVKRSGRRFGYFHSGSIFGDKGPVVFPKREKWASLSYTNSRLFTYLMLAQTAERMWEAGQVSKTPWREELEGINSLETLSKEAVGHLISKRQYDFISPYYNGPVLLDALGLNDPLPQYVHPHRELREELELHNAQDAAPSDSVKQLGTEAAKHLEGVEQNLQSCADDIDDAVFDCFNITDEQREIVLQEIELRTIEDPREQEKYDPESISEPSNDFPEQVKDLLLHFTLRAIHEANDGIIPISEIEGKDNLLTHIEAEFKRIWGEYATDRLAEVDEILGNKSASDEAYPNLRTWLEDDLFEYHVSKFDRTPILWQFTTERLVSDTESEGLGCLVDYHQLDASIFDRIQNQYLEPRRTHLRERRTAANSRRNDESLSTSEQAGASEEHKQCDSGLEQLSVFEERLGGLAESTPREWPDENQERAAEAAERVSKFREQTASRLNNLEDLAELEGTDMEDLFSPSFYATVEKNKDEWIDALDDLQTAFESYAEDGSKPVEAHLYDLFEYYDDLIGSSHYASNGILFMTYYFDQFEDPEQSQIGDAGDTEQQKLLSKLGANLDEYTQLANEISEDCDAVAADIPNDWEERALSEVTTTGYQPVHKHGVAINITPLAEKDIVPEIVEDKVL